MYIFRVENEKGDGPYTAGHEAYQIVGYHTHMNGRPSPHFDRKLLSNIEDEEGNFYIAKYHFGFVSLIQLFKWFENVDREQLSEIGFTISVVQVPDEHVFEGYKQCCFDKKFARVVMSKRLSIYPRKAKKNEIVSNRVTDVNLCTSPFITGAELVRSETRIDINGTGSFIKLFFEQTFNSASLRRYDGGIGRSLTTS